jgi:hypothetical protein
VRKLGSAISVFVNALSIDPGVPYEPPDLYSPGVISVINYFQATPFVLQVNLQLPTSSSAFECQIPNTSACLAGIVCDLYSYLTAGNLASTGGLGFGGLVWFAP